MNHDETTREASLQEIELVDAPNIFHDNEDGLQHELIDASQANRIVNTLKSLKNKMNQSQV